MRDLAAREMACCSFMTFTVTPSEGQLLVDAEVPAEAAPTLDGLAGIAERAAQRWRGERRAAHRAARRTLTDCSCGQGRPLPVLEITGPGGPDGDHGGRLRNSIRTRRVAAILTCTLR